MPAKKQLTDLEMRAALQAKIEECSQSIGHQSKDGSNNHSNYGFTSNEQMMAAVRMAWPKHQIGVTCDVETFSEKEFKNHSGKIVIRSTVGLKVTIVDLLTGFTIESKFVGCEQCTQGKSMQKAITAGFKYWIFKNFKVSSQMEVDPDTVDVEIDPTETAIYEIQNANTIEQLKKLYAKYSKLGPTVVSEITNRKKQLLNAKA